MSDREEFERAVNGVSRPDPYALIYTAQVVKDWEDGTVDVKVIDGPFEDVLRVQFDSGLLGGAYAISEIEQVRLAFSGGRPDGGFVFSIRGAPAAARAVARVGDTGIGGSFSALGVALGAPIQFQYNPPAGGIPSLGPAVAIGIEIRTGSDEVKLR
ncbi:MAG: hypothetical protein ABI193_23710 [Minicystis sp.]